MMEVRNTVNFSNQIAIYDITRDNLIAENLEKLVRKINSFNLQGGCRFTSAGYKNQFYINEIQEFVVVVNDKHILTNEGKFKLNRVYNNEAELEDLARYFLKCLEVGCGMMF